MAVQASWHNVEDGSIASQVVDFLDHRDRENLRTVNKFFNENIACVYYVSSVEERDSSAWFKTLDNPFTNSVRFNVTVEEFIGSIGRNSGATIGIAFELVNLSGEIFQCINFCTNLRAVAVKASPETTSDATVELLSQQCQAVLQSVNFDLCHDLTDNSVMHLSSCPSLRSVNFNYCWLLTDEAARHLSTCPLLESVVISYCRNLTDKTARYLSKCPSLQLVNFAVCEGLTDEAAKLLSKCLSLRSVNFAFSRNLTYKAAMHLSECQRLQSVDFTNCLNLTDEAARALYTCLNLQSVILPTGEVVARADSNS